MPWPTMITKNGTRGQPYTSIKPAKLMPVLYSASVPEMIVNEIAKFENPLIPRRSSCA
jgi:hypothetical protein